MTPRAPCRCRRAGRFRTCRHHLCVQRRQVAVRRLQVQYEWRLRAALLPQRADALAAKDNGAGSLENANGNSPTPQDFNNLDAEYAFSGYHQPYNMTNSFVWALPFGRGEEYVRCVAVRSTLLVGGWQVAGISIFYAGDPVTFTYTPAAQRSGLGHRAGLPRPEHLSSEPDWRSVPADGSRRSPTGSTATASSCRPISQPFGNAPRNIVRGPVFWQVDFAMSKHFAIASGSRISSSGSRRSICSTARISGRQTATAAPARSARSRRRTIRGSCSWG